LTIEKSRATEDGILVGESVHPENFTADMIQGFLGYMSKNRLKKTSKGRQTDLLSAETLDQYSSAIMAYYFKMNGSVVPDHIGKAVADFKKDYVKVIADKREAGEHPLKGGKSVSIDALWILR
jgi:hypothetical protein